MTPAVWSAVAAWTALGLGAVNLWYGVLRPWWRTRRADPSVQLDLLHYRDMGGKWREESRIVITNQGAALMEAIEVQAFDAGGMSLAITDPTVTALWPTMPVERLHPGQSLYLTLSPGLGTPTPARVLVEWGDKRGARQSRMVEVSYHRIF